MFSGSLLASLPKFKREAADFIVSQVNLYQTLNVNISMLSSGTLYQVILNCIEYVDIIQWMT